MEMPLLIQGRIFIWFFDPKQRDEEARTPAGGLILLIYIKSLKINKIMELR
jgi:hypothetical protein